MHLWYLSFVFVAIHSILAMDLGSGQPHSDQSYQGSSPYFQGTSQEILTEEEKEARTDAFINALNECYQSVDVHFDMLNLKKKILHDSSLMLHLSREKEANVGQSTAHYFTLPEESLQKALPFLGKLTWLKQLQIYSQFPAEISSVLQQTPFVEELDLSENQLMEVPKVVTTLSRLKKLVMNNNKFSSLPDDMENLKNLEELILKNNQLSDLPENLTELDQLKKLILCDNYFTTLPEYALHFKNMNILNISRNPLLTKSYEAHHKNRLGREDLEKDARVQLIDDIDQQSFDLFGDDIFPSQLLAYYKNELSVFASSIFSDLPGTYRDRIDVSSPLSTVDKVIYNDSGYPNPPEDRQKPEGKKVTYPPDGMTDADGVQYIRGKPMFLKKSTPVVLDGTRALHNDIVTEDIPIDYTIHLPKGKVNAICVHVYGGIIPVMRPAVKRAIHKYLLSQGIAFVELNLVDLSLLNIADRHVTGRPHQSEMDNKMQAKIHGSIHAVWEMLKNNPGILLENQENQLLNEFMGKDIFLFGASFGGRTAIRHAEFYPGTFTGYISHDGGLAYRINEQASRAGIIANPSLYPIEDIQNIGDPILVLQNYDDNQVRNNVATDFVEKAQILGKNVKLLISSRGSKTNERGKTYKGHYTPDGQEDFDLYAKTILSFIESKSQSIMPSVTKWRTTEGKLYANKDYKHVNLKDKFMSYAYRLHIYENTDNKGNLHPWWNILTKEGVTDSSIYDALAYVDAMKKDPTLYTKFKRKIEELPELLSDAVLNNALESYIHLFVEYLKETKPPLENTPTDKFIEFYMESPEIKDILRKAVLEKYNPAFLTYLFLGNPDLYADFSSELVEDPVRSVEKAATLQELQDKVNQINASVMDTWKSAFKAVREKGRHSQAK